LLWFYPRATEEVSGWPFDGMAQPSNNRARTPWCPSRHKNLVYPVTLCQNPERPINRVLAWYRVGCATPVPPVPFFGYRSGQMAFSHRDNGQYDGQLPKRAWPRRCHAHDGKAVRTPDRDQLHRLLPASKCAFHVTLEQRGERLVVLPLRMLRRERLDKRGN
jgi:hypothetical protein